MSSNKIGIGATNLSTFHRSPEVNNSGIWYPRSKRSGSPRRPAEKRPRAPPEGGLNPRGCAKWTLGRALRYVDFKCSVRQYAISSVMLLQVCENKGETLNSF